PCPASGSRNVEDVSAGTHTARFEVSDGARTTSATTTYTVAPPVSTEPFDLDVRFVGPVDADVRAAFEAAATRWEQAITRGLSDLPITSGPGSCGSHSALIDEVVDDLVVQVWMSTEPFPYAAWASPCAYGPDGLPRHAWVEVNSFSLDDVRALGNLD